MKGSVNHQTGYLMTFVNEIGESKSEAKEEARQELESQGLPATSERIAELTGIHSVSTAENYIEKWQELGDFARSEMGIRDMGKLDGETVKAFLQEKIEAGVSYSHFSGYCAAFGKLETALERFSEEVKGIDRDYGFRDAIGEVRPEAREELPRFEGTRNYDDPSRLIQALPDVSSLVARIQLESGARLSEASKISSEQLKGITNDKMTGKEIGQFNFTGKGGKDNTGNLSPGTYQDLVKHVAEYGSLNVSADAYRDDLKTASTATGQDYNGSHGLRWNMAQERYQELRENGVGHVRALGQVSKEMGHNRVEITEHYLGK